MLLYNYFLITLFNGIHINNVLDLAWEWEERADEGQVG